MNKASKVTIEPKVSSLLILSLQWYDNSSVIKSSSSVGFSPCKDSFL